MRHLNAFNYKFLAPTNTRGNRIAITNRRYDYRVVISWCYSATNKSTAEQVADHLEALGYTLEGFNEDYHVIMVREFFDPRKAQND